MGEHCSVCSRNFKNEEALAMHNAAKHGANAGHTVHHTQRQEDKAEEKKESSNTMKISKGIVITFVVVVGILALLFWLISATVQESSAISVSAEDDPFLGNPNAPVTIIEFGDYQCPICQRFHATTLPIIKEQYIDTGKVKYVFRDFPLVAAHPLAQISAEAANCVLESGGSEAYFEYHDKLYNDQNSISRANLLSWASEQGYDIGECLSSGRQRAEVQADFQDGQRSGVSGTPSFFINGKPLGGAQPFPVFQQLIESEL